MNGNHMKLDNFIAIVSNIGDADDQIIGMDDKGKISVVAEAKTSKGLFGGFFSGGAKKDQEIDQRCIKLADAVLTMNADKMKGSGAYTRENILDVAIKLNTDNAQTGVKVSRENTRLNAKVDELSGEVTKLKTQLQATENEKSSLLHRLAQAASNKLTDNNPKIADLSDPNRPNKLGEYYSELYDNEWSDAYESLDTEGRNKEEILQTLKDIMTSSHEAAKEEISKLEKDYALIMGYESYSDMQADVTFDSNRVSFEAALKKRHSKKGSTNNTKDIDTQIVTKVKAKVNTADNDSINKYREKCAYMAKVMNLHRPPMTLAPQPKHGAKFDTDCYRAYSKAGSQVDYVVWPALLMYENGPMLTKGCAEGIKDS